MVRIALLFCLLGFAFFDCNKKPVVKGPVGNMEGTQKFTGKSGDIEYTFTASLQKKGMRDGVEHLSDTLAISYELKNTGTKDYVVFNRGHFGKDTGNAVYTEPLPDGGIEISQKAFSEPSGLNCPQRFVAIFPRASWLKAGKIAKEEVTLALPFRLNTPYDDCQPQPEMPKEPKSVKFCIGYSEADSKKITINEQGSLSDISGIATKQKFLCSDSISLK
jgi:hypothetical protein